MKSAICENDAKASELLATLYNSLEGYCRTSLYGKKFGPEIAKHLQRNAVLNREAAQFRKKLMSRLRDVYKDAKSIIEFQQKAGDKSLHGESSAMSRQLTEVRAMLLANGHRVPRTRVIDGEI